MGTCVSPIQPGTEADAAACAFAIFGSDMPPVDPGDYNGSWRMTLQVIVEEWVGEGHTARTCGSSCRRTR